VFVSKLYGKSVNGLLTPFMKNYDLCFGYFGIIVINLTEPRTNYSMTGRIVLTI